MSTFTIFGSYLYFEFLPWLQILYIQVFMHISAHKHQLSRYLELLKCRDRFVLTQYFPPFKSFLANIAYLWERLSRWSKEIIDFWTGVSESSNDFLSVICRLFSAQMPNSGRKIGLKIWRFWKIFPTLYDVIRTSQNEILGFVFSQT